MYFLSRHNFTLGRKRKILFGPLARVLGLLCLLTGESVLGRDGLSIGLNTGFEADTYKYAQRYAAIGLNNAKIVATRNFWNQLDGAVTLDEVLVDIGNLADDAVLADSGLTGIVKFKNFPVHLKNRSGDNKYFRPQNNVQSLISVPLGGNIKYSKKFLLLRLGFVYDLVLSDSFQPVVENSLIWNDNVQDVVPVGGGTLSAQNISDLVLQNAADTGLSILPSTGGRDVTISQKIQANRVEAPLSLAVQFINTYALKAYVGGGLTYYYGSVTRILQDTLPNSIADIDRYEGSALGFHLLMGVEYEVVERLGLSAEIFFNYGDSGPVADQVITEDPYTVSSFFHDPVRGDRPGPEDRNDPAYSRLEFSGVRFLLGVNYYILD